MLFNYSGIDRVGKKVSGKLESVSSTSAKNTLKKSGILVTTISQTQPNKTFFTYKAKKGIKPIDLSNISKEMAMYLGAGIPLVNSVKMLATQYVSNQKTKLFFESILGFLNEGKTFYKALELQNVYTLPPFYMQSIKVSESSGILDKVLMELSRFLKEQDRIKKQISSAMAYPLFIFFVSIGAVGFMMGVVVPKITAVFESMNQELPPITQFVIGMSDFVANNYMSLIIGALVFVILFTIGYKKIPQFKYRVDFFILKTPIVNKMVEANQLSQFSYITSLLISSGVTLTQAISLSSEILSNSVIKDAFGVGAKKVVEGERLSYVLQKQRYKVDTSFIQALSIGEETSSVPNILENMAVMYKERNSDKIAVMMGLLEPMMMLVVGGFVGFIVLSMLLPIFSMNLG